MLDGVSPLVVRCIMVMGKRGFYCEDDPDL